MIFRLSQKLSAKIKVSALGALALHENPLADWSASWFVACRKPYILLCNTKALISTVMSAKGITSERQFVERSSSSIKELMQAEGNEDVYARSIVPETGSITFAKALNRSVNPSFFNKGENKLPVERVRWDDCQKFLKKLAEKEKKSCRLPTEAEWEYACRAGTTTPFNFGENISTDQANYLGDAVYGNGKKGEFRKKTTPVGSFPANAWGLHDMHGNVWQWCRDWYGEYPQKDAVDPQGPATGKDRVMRGGSWGIYPDHLRSACRYKLVPTWGDDAIGLRVCFSLE